MGAFESERCEAPTNGNKPFTAHGGLCGPNGCAGGRTAAGVKVESAADLDPESARIRWGGWHEPPCL